MTQLEKNKLLHEVANFIIDKCNVINDGNYKIISEMIINDAKSIQSKLQTLVVISENCNHPYKFLTGLKSNSAYCHRCGKRLE